jgi:O-antigen ligase
MMSLEPITKDAKNFFIGKGPGNYMSWTGMNFNPKLVKKYNDDLHGQFSTDAYQAFNNIIGFLGEIGFLGFLIYYLLVFKILFVGGKTITNNQKNSKTALFQVVVFSLLLSTMVHIFDDAYYSLSFWLLSGILYRKIKDENINCNALIQSRAVHRGNDKVSVI